MRDTRGGRGTIGEREREREGEEMREGVRERGDVIPKECS